MSPLHQWGIGVGVAAGALVVCRIGMWLADRRRPREVPLTDLVPGLEEATEEDEELAFNEELLGDGIERARRDHDLLYVDPVVHCVNSGPKKPASHGYRLAVRRRDMRVPLCVRCTLDAMATSRP